MSEQPTPVTEDVLIFGKCDVLKSCTRDAVVVLITGHHACQKHYDELKELVES